MAHIVLLFRVIVPQSFFISRGFIMMKSTLKLLIPTLMLLASSAFADIIKTDLTENDYITYQGIDWTWASPVNVSSFYNNELKAPTFHTGWRYATQEELDILRLELTLANFTRIDASGAAYYVESVQYWNTVLSDVDSEDFVSKKINSELAPNFKKPTEWDFETFYVRVTPPAQPITVPEPTTLLIFGATLIGFSLRQRMTK